LAQVNADRLWLLYVEHDPLPTNPSALVREVVYPLLDRGAVALLDPASTEALREFVAGPCVATSLR
jgi:hypothetical protein